MTTYSMICTNKTSKSPNLKKQIMGKGIYGLLLPENFSVSLLKLKFRSLCSFSETKDLICKEIWRNNTAQAINILQKSRNL